MVLNMLNLYTFILASFSKISDMSIQLQDIKRNLTNVSMQPSELMLGRPELLTPLFTTVVNNVPTNIFSTNYSPSTASQCYVEKVNCSTRSTQMNETMTSSSTSSPTTPWTQSSSQTPSTISTLTTLFLLSTTMSNNSMLFDTDQSNLSVHSNDNDNEKYNQESLMTGNSVSGYYGYDYDSINMNDSSVNLKRRNVGTGFVNKSGATNFIIPLSVELFNYNKYSNESLEEEDENFLSPEDYPENNTIVFNMTDYDYDYNASTTEPPSTATDDGCTYVTICPDSSSTSSSSGTYTFTTGSQSTASVSMTPVYLPESTEAWPQKTPSPTTVSGGEYQIPKDLSLHTKNLDIETRRKLRSLCWETMFGQELVKLTVMDLVLTILSTLVVDFIRAIFVRVMNNCWCWDLEKKFPQYGDFKIAENILHLVNNQGMVWMGMFFSPGLPLINLIKLVIMMYLRSWTVLTCNVPHEVVFRASRSNNFYLALLLTMLFLCVLPVSYAIVWVEPSWHCGPFSNYEKIYHLFTNSTKKALPSKTIHKALDYIASPGIVIPLFLLLVLIIYYLVSLTNALREANNDLKFQLRRERTEERRKVFQMVDRKHRGGSQGDLIESTPFQKWQKTLNVLPGSKSDQTSNNTREEADGNIKNDAKKLLHKLTKHTIHKHGPTEERVPIVDADGTDVEQAESLPDDNKMATVHHHSHHHTKHQVHSKPQIPIHHHHHTQHKSPPDGTTEFADVHTMQRKAHHERVTDDDVFQEKQTKIDKHKGRDKKHSQPSAKHHSTIEKDSFGKNITKQDHLRKDSIESVRSDKIPQIRISQSTDDESSTDGTKQDRPSKSSSADTIIEQMGVDKDAAYKVKSDDINLKEKQTRHHGSSHTKDTKQSDTNVTTSKHKKSQDDTNIKGVQAAVIKHDKISTHPDHTIKSDKSKSKEAKKPTPHIIEPKLEVMHKESEGKHVDKRKGHKNVEKKLKHEHLDEASSSSSKEKIKPTIVYESEDSGEDEKVMTIKKKKKSDTDKIGASKHVDEETVNEELSFKVKPRRRGNQTDDVTTKSNAAKRRASGQIESSSSKHNSSSSTIVDNTHSIRLKDTSSGSLKRHEDRKNNLEVENNITGKYNKKSKKKSKEKEKHDHKVKEDTDSDSSVKTEKMVTKHKTSQPLSDSDSEDDKIIISTTTEYDEPVMSVLSEESDFQNDEDDRDKIRKQSKSNSTISSKQSMESRSQSQSRDDDDEDNDDTPQEESADVKSDELS